MTDCLWKNGSISTVWNVFDKLFEDFEDAFCCDYTDGSGITGCFSKAYPQFPPVDVYLKSKDDKTIIFEFMVAGYDEKNINLDFCGNQLTLSLTKKDKEYSDRKYLKRGVRHSNVEAKYYIPANKYNFDEVSAKLKDGVLTVTIPTLGELNGGPKKIKIERETIFEVKG